MKSLAAIESVITRERVKSNLNLFVEFVQCNKILHNKVQ